MTKDEGLSQTMSSREEETENTECYLESHAFDTH